MAHIQKVLLFIALAVILAGCLSVSTPFEDDFSDPASGWGSASHETYVRGYQLGRYLIQIDVPQWLVWTTSGRSYQDVAVEVMARSDDARDNHYGILCRYDEGQFYYFAVSTDGYYAIFRQTEEGDLTPLTGRAMLRSSLINTDGTENRLLAVCEGPQLIFYINGEQAAQVTDDVLTQGDVGMAAGTVDQGGTIVWFDNFKTSEP